MISVSLLFPFLYYFDFFVSSICFSSDFFIFSQKKAALQG